MMACDLCGASKQCLQKEIDGKEYDFCPECWHALMAKLEGKGTEKRDREMVLLPPLPLERQSQAPNPVPGEPPKIWDRALGSH